MKLESLPDNFASSSTPTRTGELRREAPTEPPSLERLLSRESAAGPPSRLHIPIADINEQALLLAQRIGLSPKPVEPAMTKHKLLDMAKAAVADRGLNYGRPEDNFNRIAARWRTHISNRFGVHLPIDATSVAIMMDDMKTARLENEPNHPDSWVDKAGYAACGAEIACK